MYAVNSRANDRSGIGYNFLCRHTHTKCECGEGAVSRQSKHIYRNIVVVIVLPVDMYGANVVRSLVAAFARFDYFNGLLLVTAFNSQFEWAAFN